MAIAAFDTLEFVESLESSGFTKEQSKGMVNAFKKAQDAQLKELATKEDITRLDRRMDSLDFDLKLIKWMLALVITATVLPALKALIG
ncbi:MAG: CCDC90 family protein [Magnetococcus sp. YQC-5]